jgi:RNA polymerase sigma factor (sigma-70 family)
MTALRDGDDVAGTTVVESFDAFFRREYPRAVKLAWLLTRSPSGAEDVAQEAMVGVYDRFAALDSPAAYLTRVVVNRCRKWHRAGTNQLHLVRKLSQVPETGLDGADEYLLDAIHALPYRQRVVIVARYWGDWSESEIAAALECRPGTVKSLASRALASLRMELER